MGEEAGIDPMPALWRLWAIGSGTTELLIRDSVADDFPHFGSGDQLCASSNSNRQGTKFLCVGLGDEVSASTRGQKPIYGFKLSFFRRPSMSMQ
ncbi:hypothetical protein M8756_15460 [Lutimaribacter sp. EGI FJ00015]|uniref:Uncharacterized protein n=1 Tax=Lutimaribacter degradans TaxID=2945989 RepID=A0ACC6A043_9RHOB|nr:hypothetical protein [Lutimaribacter sp. EGI FJ00013]MCM2563538.1 hypothetical protein [Lutimaribacter sp. EGI FJ00013]MCO0614718.1 hypothetical protein [Lutimaribacter sp. EGI FJ00015]MCO0637388.1 hypothetical protein [Lutimaribacter sp. EGI FJ00014]